MIYNQLLISCMLIVAIRRYLIIYIQYIVCDENIKLAYRNIKRNSGSVTSGTDGITVNDIEKIPLDKFVAIVKKKFQQT